jgi:hypothetical protein
MIAAMGADLQRFLELALVKSGFTLRAFDENTLGLNYLLFVDLLLGKFGFLAPKP